jgi:NADH-quinone oxidoreductase subunit M
VPLLTLSWALPLAGAILLLLIPNRQLPAAVAAPGAHGHDDHHPVHPGGQNDGLFRWMALAISLVVFGATLMLWAGFDSASAEYQFVERVAWIPQFGIDYYVGIDGISLLLIVLTGFLTPIALLSSWEGIGHKVKEFSVFVLALEAAMIGVFVSLDLFLFYVFWDAMLIPMYFLIGIWGYDQRIYDAVKIML